MIKRPFLCLGIEAFGMVLLLMANVSANAAIAADTLSAQPGFAVKILSRVGSDARLLLNSPFKMTRGNLSQFAAVSIASAVLIHQADQSIDAQFSGARTFAMLQPMEELADVGDVYDQIGSKVMVAGIPGVCLGSGLLLGNQKLVETSGLMMESLIFTSLITYLGKRAFGRARPYLDRGSRHFGFFESSATAFRSMPSGHASTAFAMMTVLAKQYPKWWIRIPAYTLASGVAMQRIDDRKHWMSDVLVGGVLGYWISSQLVGNAAAGNWRIAPRFSSSQFGVKILF